MVNIGPVGPGPYREAPPVNDEPYPPLYPWRKVSVGGSCPICGEEFVSYGMLPKPFDQPIHYPPSVTTWRCQVCKRAYSLYPYRQPLGLKDRDLDIQRLREEMHHKFRMLLWSFLVSYLLTLIALTGAADHFMRLMGAF